MILKYLIEVPKKVNSMLSYIRQVIKFITYWKKINPGFEIWSEIITKNRPEFLNHHCCSAPKCISMNIEILRTNISIHGRYKNILFKNDRFNAKMGNWKFNEFNDFHCIRSKLRLHAKHAQIRLDNKMTWRYV